MSGCGDGGGRTMMARVSREENRMTEASEVAIVRVKARIMDRPNEDIATIVLDCFSEFFLCYAVVLCDRCTESDGQPDIIEKNGWTYPAQPWSLPHHCLAVVACQESSTAMRTNTLTNGRQDTSGRVG